MPRPPGRAALLLSLLVLPFAALGQQPLAGQSAAPGAAVVARTPLAALPPVLAGLRRSGATNLSAEPGGEGLGVVVDYTAITGASAAVFWYDRDRCDLVDGPDQPTVEQEMQTVRAEVNARAEIGQYRYRLLGNRPVAPVAWPTGAPGLRCESLDFEFANSRRLDGFFCVGIVRAHFLKLRISFPAGPPDASEARMQAFGRGLLAALL